MTGFGKAETEINGKHLTAELKSVNHRFLEMNIRLPKAFSILEPRIRVFLQKKISRGAMTATISLDNEEEENILRINEKSAEYYYNLLRDLKRRFNLSDSPNLQIMTAFPEIFRVEKKKWSEEKSWLVVKRLLSVALSDLVTMQEREGRHLGKEILRRLQKIEDKINQIEKDTPKRIYSVRKRLKEKIENLLENRKIDEGRLTTEIAFLAERCDVTEECVRLKSHITQFRRYLKINKPVGRRLDFLLQEMNREINTIGSKATDAGVSQEVVILKDELEKIREQVQNIE